MTDPLNLLRSYNFTNLPVDAAAPVIGVYNLSYKLPADSAVLQDVYYESGSPDYSSVSTEVTSFREASFQASAIARILAGSPSDAFSVYFEDVAKLNIAATTGDEVDIVIAQNDGTSALYVDNYTGGATWLYNGNPLDASEGRHGDIFFNEDYTKGWGTTSQGSEQFYIILHELGHAIGGFKEGGQAFSGGDADKDTSQYTVMSYRAQGWEPDGGLDNQIPTNNALYASAGVPLFAYGLQLYDIAALQSIYGANTSVRTGDTEYKLGQGLGQGDEHNAFIYTIWDGDADSAPVGPNIGDTLDASDFTKYGAKIDLREGEFSSIGENGIGGAAYDPLAGREVKNVAIAKGVTIENAKGTNKDDHITGNDVSNRLTGNKGNDEIHGGAGNDIYFYNKGDGTDTIYDDGDENIISFENVAINSVTIGVAQSSGNMGILLPDGGILATGQYDGIDGRTLEYMQVQGVIIRVEPL